MSVRADASDEVGRGPLSAISLGLYRALVLEVALLVALSPTAFVWAFLVPDPTNVWLYGLSAFAVAPALSAGLYARRAWVTERDQRPTRALWRGYRRGFVPTLRWWLPALAIACVLVTNVAFAEHVPGGAALRPAAAVLLALLLVVAGHLTVIVTFFSFRLCDAVRVAIACVGRCWRSSLGVLALGVLTAGLGVLGGGFLVLALAFALVHLAWLNARPVLDYVTETFTRHG